MYWLGYISLNRFQFVGAFVYTFIRRTMGISELK
jgi:hypothetical protein